MFEESPVESQEYQNNPYIHNQPFPKPVSEEQGIHTNNDSYHQQYVKHVGSCVSFHLPSSATNLLL
jgi:hypothetical protein